MEFINMSVMERNLLNEHLLKNENNQIYFIFLLKILFSLTENLPIKDSFHLTSIFLSREKMLIRLTFHRNPKSMHFT